jgi:hypothetical protein
LLQVQQVLPPFQDTVPPWTSVAFEAVIQNVAFWAHPRSLFILIRPVVVSQFP